MDLSSLLLRHCWIRAYLDRPIDASLIDRVLDESLAGSSSSGNLNMVSVVKTRDVERKAHLATLHFDQPMVRQAPLVLTFCADTYRTRQWLAQREARPGFADFISWHVAAFDAVILAQTAALAFQSQGLGICYMGTTLHSMGTIAEFLELPENCLPVTRMVVGGRLKRRPSAIACRPTPGSTTSATGGPRRRTSTPASASVSGAAGRATGRWGRK